MDLYREVILEHWQNPRHKGKIKNPTHIYELENVLCGDKIKIEIEIKNGSLKQAGFSGEGCAVSQASASLLMEQIYKLKVIKKIKKIDEEKVFKLLGIKPSPARIKCALLPLQVLRKTLNQK